MSDDYQDHANQHHANQDHDELAGWPAFARELHATLPTQSQYVLYGNAHDAFLIDDRGSSQGRTAGGASGGGAPAEGHEPAAGGAPRLLTLTSLLCEVLRRSGYRFLVDHDLVDGPELHAIGTDPDALAAARELFGDGFRPGGRAPDLPGLHLQLSLLARPQRPVRGAALIRASQLIRTPADPDGEERQFIRRMEKLARTAEPVVAGDLRKASLYNPIIWVVAQEHELPAWLTAGKERVRSIALPAPDYGDRERTARLLLRRHRLADAELTELATAFAEQSEGLSLQGMIEATRLAHDRGMGPRELPDAARTYKLGVLDNPWRRDFLRTRIADGETSLPARVMGQPQAVTKTLDILKRAALGLSGAQAARSSARPRGVLFFAGPTGVGKTELAKSVAQLVFGDESAYLRFDMSEFSAEHAGERFVGAPPGYIGFESGGELTNAVRAQPFRVILFDEIEKAHPRILDKFLQILEDGRLTDGRGSTVHFSECILIFTSNLGMFVTADDGTVVPTATPGTPYVEVEQRVRAAIEDHFTRVLRRPELLNRLGDNIVVFDFISPDTAAAIFDQQLRTIVDRVRDEQEVEVDVAPDARDALRRWCTADLVHGGRGVGSALETAFVNPLARALFAMPAKPAKVTVSGVRAEPDGVVLDLS